MGFLHQDSDGYEEITGVSNHQHFRMCLRGGIFGAVCTAVVLWSGFFDPELVDYGLLVLLSLVVAGAWTAHLVFCPDPDCPKCVEDRVTTTALVVGCLTLAALGRWLSGPVSDFTSPPAHAVPLLLQYLGVFLIPSVLGIWSIRLERSQYEMCESGRPLGTRLLSQILAGAGITVLLASLTTAYFWFDADCIHHAYPRPTCFHLGIGHFVDEILRLSFFAGTAQAALVFVLQPYWSWQLVRAHQDAKSGAGVVFDMADFARRD